MYKGVAKIFAKIAFKLNLSAHILLLLLQNVLRPSNYRMFILFPLEISQFRIGSRSS